jgi:hypothetical protein
MADQKQYPPIRVSYSILSAWARGDVDRAIAPFLGEEVLPTQAMIEGKEWHKKWEDETNRTGCRPKIFGGEKLTNARAEVKLVRQLTDWCTLSGVIDLMDDEQDEDHKTGKSTATDYANGFQHKVYHVLDPSKKRFRYNCFNQHLPSNHPDAVTVSIVHLTRKTLEEGIEYVLTHAAELREYLIREGYGDRLAREVQK